MGELRSRRKLSVNRGRVVCLDYATETFPWFIRKERGEREKQRNDASKREDQMMLWKGGTNP